MSTCLSVRRRFIFLTQFFSRTTGIISSKPDTKHYWGKRFQVFFKMNGHVSFLGEIIKKYWKLVGNLKKNHLKNRFARTAVNCVESLSGNVNSSFSKSWSLRVGLDHNKVAELFYLGIYRNKSLYHIKTIWLCKQWLL